MRALLVGLVGVVLAGGVAEAAGCRLDGLELVAEKAEQSPETVWQPKAPSRSDLIGKQFRVIQAASRFERSTKSLPRPTGADGKVFVIVESAGERFAVEQTYDTRTIPEETSTSYPAVSPRIDAVPWGARAIKAEAARVNGFFEISEGPLSGLVLKPTNCS